MHLWIEKGAWASSKAHLKADRLDQQKINSIAVIRHAALGDMVLVRPFLLELRKHFPNARITLSLVTKYVRGVPEDLVDRIHVMYGSDRRDVSRREQIKKIKELGHHDLIFDLAATSRSFWLCLLNSAGLKLGFPYRSLQRKLFYDAAVLRSDMKFEAETMLDLLNLLSLKTAYPPKFDMPGDLQHREKPYLVYFTSASTPDKCWPKDKFASLLDELSTIYPEHDHIVLEGIAEWESIEDIIAPLKKQQNVMGMELEGVEATISLLKGAELLVSNDTGIRNLAIASGTPTVGIFFATIPFRYWPRFGRHEAVFNSDASHPAVEDVFQAVHNIMKSQSS